jgi:hypothetical protein
MALRKALAAALPGLEADVSEFLRQQRPPPARVDRQAIATAAAKPPPEVSKLASHRVSARSTPVLPLS